MPDEPLTPPWAYYQRKGLSEMRPYVPGENLSGISVSEPDMNHLAYCQDAGTNPGGYVARNPKNHADQWYVAQVYFEENLEPVSARDDTAELVTQLAECCRLSGADTNDDEDWRLAPRAVEEVRQLRQDYDDLSRAEDELLKVLEAVTDRAGKLTADFVERLLDDNVDPDDWPESLKGAGADVHIAEAALARVKGEQS